MIPVIAKRDSYDLDSAKNIVKKYLSELMVLGPDEQEFLSRFENKKYMPELLFKDKDILERIKMHPMALWKIGQ